MDKPKSKDDMRAAGKKRLEQFRQKRQNKAGPTKTATASSKPEADGDSHASESNHESSIPTASGSSEVVSGHIETARPLNEEESTVGSPDTFGTGLLHETRIDNPDINGISSREVQEALSSDPDHIQEAGPSSGFATCGALEDHSQNPDQVEGAASSLEVNVSPQYGAQVEKAAQHGQEKHFVVGDGIRCVEYEVESRSQDAQEIQTGKTQLMHSPEVSYDGLQEGSIERLQSPSEVEDLTDLMKKVTEERRGQSFELEVWPKDPQQAIEDGNQPAEKPPGTFQCLEMADEETRPGMQSREEESQLLLDEDFSDPQLHDIRSDQYNMQNQIAPDIEHFKRKVSLLEAEIADLKYLKAQVLTLEGEKTQLTMDLGESNQQLQVVSAEKGGLMTQLDSLQQSLDAEIQHKVKLMFELEQSRKSSWELNEEKAQAATQFIALQQQLKELHEKEAHLQLELSNSQQQLQGALGKVEAITSGLEEVHLQLKKAEGGKLEVEMRLEETHQELLQARSQMEVLEAAVQNNDDKVIEMARREEETVKELYLQLKNAEDGKSEVDRRLEETQQELLQVRSQNENLGATLQKNEDKLIEMGGREERMVKELAHMQSQVQATEVENSGLVERLEECTQRMKDTELEVAEIMRLLGEANNERVGLVDELNQHKVQLGFVSSEKLALANELGQTKEELQKLVDQLVVTSDKNMQQLRKVEEEKHDLEEELLNLRHHFSELNDRNGQLVAELDGYSKQTGRLGEDNAELLGRLKEVQDKQGKLMAEKEALVIRLEDFQEQASKGGEREAELVSELSNMRCQMQMLNEEKQQLVADLHDLAEVAKKSGGHTLDLEHELKEVKLQLQRSDDEKGKLLFELGEGNAELVGRLKEMQDEQGKLMAEKEALVTRLEDFQEQASKDGEREAELVNELSNMRVHMQMLNEEKQQLVADLHDLAEAVKKSGGHKLDLEHELEDVKLQLQRSDDEKGKLLIELDEHRKQMQRLEDEKAELGVEIQEAKHQLQKLHDERHKLSSELGEQKEQFADMQAQLQQQLEGGVRLRNEADEEKGHLMSLLDGHREVLQKTQEEALQLEHSLREVESQLCKVVEENDVLKGELQSLHLQCDSLAERETLLLRELEAANQERSEMESGRFSLELELAALNKQVQVTGNEKALLSDQLETLVQQMEELNVGKLQVASDLDSSKQQLRDLTEEDTQMRIQLEKEKSGLQLGGDEKAQVQKEREVGHQLVQNTEQRNEEVVRDLEASSLRVQELLNVNDQLIAEFESAKLELTKVTEENARSLQELEETKHQKLAVEEENTHLKIDLDLLQQQLRGKEVEIARLGEDLDATARQLAELTSRSQSEKAELNAAVNDLQQHITEGDANHANKVSILEARLNVAESTSLKLEKAVQEFLPGGRQSSSTAPGVSKLIKAFEAKAGTRGSDRILIQDPEMQSQTEIALHAEIGSQLQQLRESEEEKACLTRALRQLEIDADSLKQRNNELEEKLTLLAELNSRLAEQHGEDTANIQSLQQQILELQNKAAEQVAQLQAGVEDMQRQLEIDAGSLKQRKNELEEKLTLLAESNSLLTEQHGEDTANIQSLQNQILELENKAAEQVAQLQAGVEDLQRDFAQQAVALQAERNSYVQALVHAANRNENAVGLAASDNSGQSDVWNACSGSDIDMAEVMQKIEDLRAVCEQLEARCVEGGCNLTVAQQDQDAATRILRAMHKKLHHLSQQQRSANDGGCQLIESLREMEIEQVGGFKEVEISAIDLVCLSQQCSSLVDELQKVLEEKMRLEDMVRELEALLSTKETNIEELTLKIGDLSQKCNSVSSQAAKNAEEKLGVEEELEKVRRLSAEQEEAYFRLYSHVNTLAERVSIVVLDTIHDQATEPGDRDAMSLLDSYVTAFFVKYETALTEVEELSQKATSGVPDAALVKELESVKDLLVSKEVEVTQLHEQILELASELDKTREDREKAGSELRQTEQKLSAVREKLSLAVTKGKGLVQQRDALKQLLAEKNAELERLTSSHKQELQLKAAALHEAELKLKTYAEAGERVEALESELSYIRNSANALRESFLQKDAVLQKIEEVLEDANLPDELQLKEIIEKIEWLVEACNQTQRAMVSAQRSTGPLVLQPEAARDQAEVLGLESTWQTQEIENLNRKYEELLRKYRSMAEQSAMLEQSLLERNFLIQRWEEVLDNIDMPGAVMSREPEDRIEWLGRAVAEAHTLTSQLQNEAQSSQEAVDTLTHDLEELQEQAHVLTAELALKELEIKRLVKDLEEVTGKYESLAEQTRQVTHETCGREVSEAELTASQERVSEQEASLEFVPLQPPQQDPGLEALVAKIQSIMGEVLQGNEVDSNSSGASFSTLLESYTKVLAEKCKTSSQEVEDLRQRLAVLDSDLSMVEKEREDHALLEHKLQSLQEALAVKDLEASNLSIQMEELTSKRSSHEDEVNGLLQQVGRLTEELALVKDERSKSQLELAQAEQKLTSIREKLSMAVKKGKSVVQQREAVKQSLDDKIAELDQVKQELQAQNLAVNEAEQKLRRLTGAMDRVERLEVELTSSRDYAASMEQSLQESNRAIQRFAAALDKISTSGDFWSRDPMEKIQWISQTLVDAQKRAGLFEQEAKKSKKAAELLALELEEVQGRMDALTDELMHAENNVSVLMGEKKAAETAKAEAGLRLEHAMANINSLLLEVSSLRESKVEFERENNSIRDALTAQMEEIRYEHLKAEQQHKDSTKLQNNLYLLKEEQAGLLHRVADEISRLTHDMGRMKALVAEVSGQLSAVKDSSAEPRMTVANYDASVEQYTFVSPSNPLSTFVNWQSEARRGEMGGAQNTTGEDTRITESPRNTSEGWEQGDLAASLIKQCEEMENDLKLFGFDFKDSTAALTQDSLAVSQLLVETCNGIEFFLQMLETLKRDTNRVTVFEALSKEKDREVLELQVCFKSLAESIKYAVEELELTKKHWSNLEQGQATANCDNSCQSLIEELDNLQKLEREGFKDLKKLAANISAKLLDTVRDFSTLEQMREVKREEEFSQLQEGAMLERLKKESQCEDLRSQLIEAKAAIENMGRQQQLDKLKINELEKAFSKSQSGFLEELQENDASLKRTKQELDSLHDLLSTKNQEEEGLVQALDEAETKTEQLSAKVEELEKAMQQKQVAIENLQASRGKALSKLSATINKLDDLRRLSEGLLAEVESLHSLLECRDTEISQLREETTNARNELINLQKLVDGKNGDLSQLHRQLQKVVIGMEIKGREMVLDASVERESSGPHQLIEVLDKKVASFLAETEGLRAQLERKDALLQDTQMRHEELAGRMNALQAALQEKQAQIERLKAGTSLANADDSIVVSADAEEMGNRGKRPVPLSPVVTHVRGARKMSAVDHFALDVDMEAGRSLLDTDDDDKGHVFKPLTSSRLVPRATRLLVDRIDGFWVAGGRLLSRKPEARLGMILYWFALHIWMVVLLL